MPAGFETNAMHYSGTTIGGVPTNLDGSFYQYTQNVGYNYYVAGEWIVPPTGAPLFFGTNF